MGGERQVIDFDNQSLTENHLAIKWRVTTTPTTIVMNAADPLVQDYEKAEVFRLPGYLKPFYFLTVLDYFASGAIENQDLKEFLSERSAAFKEKGIGPEVW